MSKFSCGIFLGKKFRRKLLLHKKLYQVGARSNGKAEDWISCEYLLKS